jgi:flavodoxin/uncharacterized protein YhbP (UPF0306 family)
MANTLVLYEGKHGTTQKTASVIAAILANAKCHSVTDGPSDINPYPNIIVVFGFYGYDTARQIKAFLLQQKQGLQGRRLAAVGIGLSAADFKPYLADMEAAIGHGFDCSCFVPGQLRLSALSQSDLDSLRVFSQKAGIPLADMGEFKIQGAIAAAEQMVACLCQPEQPMEAERLKSEIEHFILTHNTLALATCANDSVRCTPLEYQYQNGSFYIISEGGQKLKGILANGRVAMAIYDPYEGMESLGGLQIAGEANLVPMCTEEYRQVFKSRKITEETLGMLPVDLLLIKIVPRRYEILSSDFKKEGFDVRQVYFTLN